MPALDIIIYPDHRLRAPTQEIEAINEDILELASKMVDAMYHHNAVGIAAIQVGHPEKMFILDGAAFGKPDVPIICINPEIIETSEEEIMMEEGCLSFPEVYIKIKRPKSCSVSFTDVNGETQSIEIDGLFSRAFQHEMDHLNGRLLIDMVNFIQKKRIRKKFK